MHVTIHTPTNGIQHSLDFYQSLGYRQISEKPVLFTDGKALVEINRDRFARAGIKLYQESWHGAIGVLEMVTHVTKTPEGYLLTDPSGVYIYLAEQVLDIDFAPAETGYGILGNFAGLSLETADMNRSVSVYQAIGFRNAGGSPEAGFVTLSHEHFGISLMRPLSCPHLFFNPSMTYFNAGNNLAVIAKIREAGIPIAEEITHFNKEGIVDNVIIRDPGGYGFFIFND